MFKHGEQQAIADSAGISKSYLSDILNRRKQASEKLAGALELASIKVLGHKNKIPWTEFVRAKRTKNKYFKGKPV